MGPEGIRKELAAFQSSIKRLTADISKTSSLWRDEKYAELASSMGNVATQSRDVMLSGERCCSSVDKFNRIAGEKY